METRGKCYSGRSLYVERDLIPIPEDLPAIGIAEGDEGLITALNLQNNNVVALVQVSYSTGQHRGWIEMNVMPEARVLSYATGV
ncbi:MAG TPA: hypothetical protein VHM16_05595 [Rubrobacteraceae bacterium]|nr:hypothetical protein [Rubrobacteraceae bacterium]